MPEIKKTTSFSFNPDAINAHIRLLQSTADRLSQTKMATLSTSEIMQLAMELASVNGQIKAFNAILNNQLKEVA